MRTVKVSSYLLVALLLVYIADATGVRNSDSRRRYWLRSLHGQATPRPSQNSNNRKPTPGNRHQPVTPGPFDNTNSESPRYGGNHHRFTPDPTDSTNTRGHRYGGNHHRVTPHPTADTGRPNYGGNHQQFTPGPFDDTNTDRPNYHRGSPHPTADTGRPNYGGNQHHVSDRPYHHRTPSNTEQIIPVPTVSFQAKLQRYLRKLTNQRQLSADTPEKKSTNSQTPTDHVHCPHHRVPCRNTGVCIDTAWFCDGENDCIDLSDEENCPA